MTAQPQTASLNLYKRLLRDYVFRYYRILIISGICMAVVAASTAGLAYMMKPLLDDLLDHKNYTMLVVVPLGIIGLALFNALGDFGQMLGMRYIGNRVITDMQLALYRHLLDSDIALFHDQSSGRLISRMTSDIMLMRLSVQQVFTSSVKEVLTMVFLVAMMVYQSWQMSLLAIVILVTIILPITRLGKRMRKLSDTTQVMLADFTAQLDGTFQGVRVVKAYGREAFETERARQRLRDMFKIYYRAARVQSAASPIVSFVGTSAVAIVIAYAGYHVMQGSLTKGDVLSFITSMILAAKPVKTLAGLTTQVQEGMAAAERFYAVLDTPPTIRNKAEAGALAITKGEITFDHASFTYSNGHGGIQDLNITISAGTTVALVGSSGAGKTTLMNLLLRFYELSDGSIRIDGQDIRDVTLDSLRGSFALVSQDVALFDDTIRSNIAYGRLDATEEEIHAAAKKAHAHDFIMLLPQGYDTPVGPMGMKLSGGQRQRLSIARAILKDARILLLDEATSALDTASERAVQTALEELMKDRTTLVIAHRLSTIQHADKILVMDHGRVVDAGTHAELLASSPTYQKLQHLVQETA